MKILVAEDDPVARRMLEGMLGKWGYTVQACADGAAAWQLLQQEDAPSLIILDWMMPHMDGLQVCQRLRQRQTDQPFYIILLTAREQGADMVAGLQAGADDYVTKPFDQAVLRARVQVGVRMVTLQQDLADRVADLQEALTRVKRLRGLLPICAYCKKIRNDRNYWEQVESYISEHSEAQFSHSICPGCYEQVVKPEIARVKSLRPQTDPP